MPHHHPATNTYQASPPLSTWLVISFFHCSWVCSKTFSAKSYRDRGGGGGKHPLGYYGLCLIQVSITGLCHHHAMVSSTAHVRLCDDIVYQNKQVAPCLEQQRQRLAFQATYVISQPCTRKSRGHLSQQLWCHLHHSVHNDLQCGSEARDLEVIIFERQTWVSFAGLARHGLLSQDQELCSDGRWHVLGKAGGQ